MPTSLCYLFKSAHEFVPVAEVSKIPKLVRGLYVLYRSVRRRSMKVVYIGMARGEQSGVKGRLRQHQRNKAEEWTHVSVYEVWDNIPAQQVEELEGLFRHIYRNDPNANRLNKQRAYKPLAQLVKRTKSTHGGTA